MLLVIDGYAILSNGLLLQWGKKHLARDATETFYLTKSYADAYYSVFLQLIADSNHGEFTNGSRIRTDITATSFTVSLSDYEGDWYWFTIGKA